MTDGWIVFIKTVIELILGIVVIRIMIRGKWRDKKEKK